MGWNGSGSVGWMNISRDDAHKYMKKLSDENELKFYSVVEKWQAEHLILPGGDLHAETFLDAVKTFLTVLDSMGTAFRVAKRDLERHVVKVRSTCTLHGTNSFLKMIHADGVKGVGSDNLNWLKRVLQFINHFLTGLMKGELLPDAVEGAYLDTLYHAHNRFVRALCKNIRYITPDCSTFYKRIYAKDEQVALLGLRELLVSLRTPLELLTALTREIEVVKELQSMPKPLPAFIINL